jgi:hypothetical protein
MMPGTDGLGFLARLPAECPAPLPAVIANSGFDGYREEAKRRGACAFLRKPVSIDELLQAVGSALASASVSDAVLASNEESVRASRERALEETEAMMVAIDRGGRASLLPSVRPLVDWLSRYYGFGMVLLTFLRGNEVCVEVAAGAGAEALVGGRFSRQTEFCDYVIDAGSTLYLTEPSRHPSAPFSQHYEVRERGIRFYMGAPLTTPRTRVVAGTLCLLDTQPHDMHGEDMRLMERLALDVGRAVESLVEGCDAALGIDRSGIVDQPLLEVLVEVAVQRASRTGGEVQLALAELLPDRPRQAASEEAYAVSGGLRFAIGELRPGCFALLHDGQDADVVRSTMATALDAVSPVRDRSSVSWRRERGAERELSAESARAIREEMLHRAVAHPENR